MNPEVAEFLGLLAPDGDHEGLLWRQLKSRKTVPAGAADATHFCIARLGRIRRLTAYQPGAHVAICIDDVGTKRNRPPVAPSLKIETRPGNELWVYLLNDPAATLEAVRTLLEALNHEGQYGDPGSYGANALFRLPGGRRPPGKEHDARLLPAEVEEVMVWTIAELYADFRFMLSIQERIDAAAERRQARAHVRPGEMLPEVEALLALLSPDMGRNDGWMLVIMALHHEGRGGDEALAIAHRWSGGGKTYDPVDLDYQWENLSSRDVEDPVTVGSVRHLAGKADRKAAEAIIAEHEALRNAAADDRIAALQDTLSPEEPVQGRTPSDAILPELLERYALRPDKRVADLWNPDTEPWALDALAAAYGVYDTARILADGQPSTATTGRVSVVKDTWARHPRRQLAQVTRYNPRMPPGFNAVVKTGNGIWGWNNTYRPRVLSTREAQPADAAHVRAFHAHMAWAYPGPGDAAFMLDLFAFKLQNPGRSAVASISVAAPQGTGRTSAAKLLGLLLGKGNFQTMSMDRFIRDNYNGFVRMPLVIVNEVEAASQQGSTRYASGRNLIDRLNELIDAGGGGDVQVREMRTDPYSITSPSLYLINSNRPGFMQLAMGDRRFDVSEGNAARMPDALAAWMQRTIRADDEDVEALDAIHRHLLARDVSEFRYWDARPSTAKRVMASEGRTGLEEAVDAAIEALGGPAVVTVSLLVDLMSSGAMSKIDREGHKLVVGMADKELMYAMRSWSRDHSHLPKVLDGGAELRIGGVKYKPRVLNARPHGAEPVERAGLVEAVERLRDRVAEIVRTGSAGSFWVVKGGKEGRDED